MVSLVKFLHKLVNQKVTIELKNDMVLQGTIIGMDVAMNTHMKDVTCIMSNRRTVILKSVSVRGSTIRQFILPEQLNVDVILEQLQKQHQLDMKKAADQAAIHASNEQSRGRGGGRGGRGGRGGGRGRGR